MKIFQVVDGFCFYDASKLHPTLQDTVGLYPPSVLFVEAPDHVFEGWGYDETKEGDERFIQPIPPDGWNYDPGTGTFYPDRELAPSKMLNPEDDRDAMLVDIEYRLTLLELGVTKEM